MSGEYDMAIRREAMSVGFAAFGTEYTGRSVLHYGAQHMKHLSLDGALFSRTEACLL